MGEATPIVASVLFIIAMAYATCWIAHRYEKPFDRMLSVWWDLPTFFLLFIGSTCAGLAVIGSLT